MAAGHSWNDISFSEAVVVGGIEFVRKITSFEHEGVDGVDVLDGGARGTTVQLKGKYKADDIASLFSWFRGCWVSMNQTDTLDLYGGDFPLDDAILRRFRFQGLRPAHGGGYYGHYLAVFFVPAGDTGDGEPL